MRERRTMYTRRQWLWAWDRFCQGYSYKCLGDFLGLHPESVRRHFVGLGLREEVRGNLPPLSERRQEFYALEDEACL